MEAFQVLYIDDELAFLEITREFLVASGPFSVDTASSAADGLALLEGRNYDAIVSDYEMPDMNGLDLLRLLRSKGNRIPFIFFTGRGSEEVVLQAYEMGADSYVQKGGNPRTQYTELAGKIEKAVEARRLEAESKRQQSLVSTVYEAIPDLVSVVRERDGTLLSANRSMLKELRLSEDHALGQKMDDLLPGMDKCLRNDEDASSKEKNETRMAPSGGSVPPQYMISTMRVNIDGEECLVTVARKAMAWKDPNPNLLGRGDCGQPIFSTAPLGVHMYALGQERKLILKWANQAADKILGIDHLPLLGEDISKIFPDVADSDLLIGLLRVSREGGTWHSNKLASINELVGSTFEAHAFQTGPDHLMVVFQSLAESYLDMEGPPRSGVEPISICRFAQQLADPSPDLDIYKAVAEQIMSDAEVVFIAFSEHLPAKKVLVCQSIHGMSTNLNRMMRLLGSSPIGMEFPLKAGWEKQQMLSGHLVPVPGGLYQITLGKLPKSLCRLGEKTLGVGSIYSIGFVRRGELLGNAIIVLKKGNRLNHERTEAICHLAAVALQRRIAEDALRESERRYRTLVERTADIVYSCDLGGNLVFISPQVRAYGYEPEDLVGRNYLDLISPQDRSEIRESVRQALVHGRDFENQYRIITTRKEVRWMESRNRILRNNEGRMTSILGVSRDITDKRKGEEALNLANKKLNLLNSITRHDLSNHITVLSGYLGLVQREAKGEQAAYLEKVDNALEKIRSEIDFARTLEKVGLRAPEWQDLGGVIQQAAAGLELKKVSLKVRVPKIKVLADPMLVNVFHNLLDNSLRHGADVGQIRIESKRSGDSIAIVYEDDGCGISEADKPHIFEKGFGKNTGLGLFLSREILELSGLSISENGRPGEGARFEMAVPEDHWA